MDDVFTVGRGGFGHGRDQAAVTLSGAAFAASGVQKASGESAPSEAGLSSVDAGREVLEQAASAEVAADDEAAVWHDAVEEDFDFQDTKGAYSDKLEQRRKMIEKREREMVAQEALLKAARHEMDRKYKELESIKAQLEDLLQEQDEQEQAHLASLVTIYEGMKAKDAAKIFNTLDMDILMRVTQAMSARKASAVFAKMDPERAKRLTVMLAEQKALGQIDTGL